MTAHNATVFRIRGELLKRGLTLRDFAKDIGVEPQRVNQVLSVNVAKNIQPRGIKGHFILTKLMQYVPMAFNGHEDFGPLDPSED